MDAMLTRPTWIDFALYSGRWLAACNDGATPGVARRLHRMYRWCAYREHPASLWG